jgi:hypothetical protein
MIRAKRPNSSTKRSTGSTWPNGANRKSQKTQPTSALLPNVAQKTDKTVFFGQRNCGAAAQCGHQRRTRAFRRPTTSPILLEIALGLSGNAFRPQSSWRIKKWTGREFVVGAPLSRCAVVYFASAGARLRLGTSSPFVDALTRPEALPACI